MPILWHALGHAAPQDPLLKELIVSVVGEKDKQAH